jgi:dolichol-phosphate mannosyltransferase
MTGQSAAAHERVLRYSLVIPVYNEEAMLPLLLHRIVKLLDQLDGSAEAIFVDDGSHDTGSIFLRGAVRIDSRLRLIELSRNFGHQIAITAGMNAARGEAVVVMDADLQDPPEVVLELIAKWKEGFDVVYARRILRQGETLFKRATANLYYRVLSAMTTVPIPRDVGDFRLVSRQALDAFKSMPESDRFVRGMFAWIGFRQAEVLFERPPRMAGETKYPLWKMVKLAIHGMLSFSEKPLRMALWAGLTICFLAISFGIYAVIFKLLGGAMVDGWASTVVLVSFLSGINLFMTGVVGLYVGGIHAEVKRRPLYIVAHDTGRQTEVAATGTQTGHRNVAS